MSTADTLTLNIDDKAYNYARIYAALLKDEYQRKRAYASMVALYAFLNTIEKVPYDIQKSMTLFRNPMINEQYEISDLYVNDWHLEVRTVTGGEAFLVPKIHFEADIVPDFYVVVKLDKLLENAELIGIADTKTMQKEAFDYHYDSVPFNNLITYDEFLKKVKNKKIHKFSQQDHDLFNSSYLSILDSEIDLETKNKILKHLFECDECRTEFCCFSGFEMVSCNMNKYPELLEDQTLNIIGAQSVDDKKYEGKEEIIEIKEEETQQTDETPNITDEIKEETISDILDELFSVDEETAESTDIQDKPIEAKIEPYVEEDNDNIKIIEDNSQDENLDTLSSNNEELQIINEEEQDLHISDDDNLEQLTDYSDENDTLESETSEEIVLIDTDDNNLVINDNDDNTINIIDDNDSLNSAEDIETVDDNNIQKVIVDYDEFGEPIYSYITNISQDEISDSNSEAEFITDYNDNHIDEEKHSEISDLSNNSDISLVEDNIDTTGSNEIILEDTELLDNNTENIVDLSEKSEIETIPDDIDNTEEYNTSQISKYDEDIQPTNTEIETIEDNGIIENIDENPNEEKIEDITNIDDNNIEIDNVSYENEKYDTEESGYKNSDIELETEDEENYENEINNTSEESNNINYEVNQDEEEGTTAESSDLEEEYDDEDMEFADYDDTNNPKKSNKILLGIITFIIVLGLGTGIFFVVKNNAKNSEKISKGNTADNSITIQNNQDTSPQDSNNDMFEQNEEGNNEENNEENHNNGEQNENPQPEEHNDDNNQNETATSGTIEIPPLTENDLIKQETNSNGDVNKVITNALSRGANPSVSLRGVNWLCTTELFTDKTFKSYLQHLDDLLKLNLKKNILDASEYPSNDNVAAKLAVDNNGNLKKVMISDSSGSEQIDNIVLQSINETFEGEKSQILNDNALKSDMYYLKVVIKL